MPGAGSLAMMNYLYNRAPRDGTVMGLPLNGVLLEPTIKLMSRAGGSASFDIQKMPWIGSTTEDAQALWFRTDSKIKSIADLKTIKSIAAASAPGADNFTVAVLTNNLLGTKMDIVRGYQGTNPIFLAVERGEAEGSATAYSAIVVARPQWLTEEEDQGPDPVWHGAASRSTRRSDGGRGCRGSGRQGHAPRLRHQSLKLHIRSCCRQRFPRIRSRSFALHLMRDIRDPAFLESAKKGGLPIRPMRGVDIEHLIAESLKTPRKNAGATARGCAAVAGNVMSRTSRKRFIADGPDQRARAAVHGCGTFRPLAGNQIVRALIMGRGGSPYSSQQIARAQSRAHSGSSKVEPRRRPNPNRVSFKPGAGQLYVGRWPRQNAKRSDPIQRQELQHQHFPLSQIMRSLWRHW